MRFRLETSPSLAIHQRTPLRRVLALRVHSRPSRSPTFGTGLLHPALVPPLSFHPTATVYSAMRRASLLHLATGHGVRRVSGRRLTPPAFPDGAVPFGAFSFLTAVPMSPPFRPSRRCFGRALGNVAIAFVCGRSPTSGCCSARKFVAFRRVATPQCSLLPWASATG